MKAILYAILNLIMLQISISAQNGGIQVGIKHDLLNNLKDKFLPGIISKYQNVSLSDKNLEYGLIVTSLNLNLSEINLRVSNFSSDNLQLTTKEDGVLFSLKDVHSEGNFNLKFSIFKFIQEQDKINFTLHIKELSSIITINSIESKIDKGKYLPTLKVSELTLDFDLDFQITGKTFAQLATYFKKFITSKIKENIISEIKKVVSEQSSQVINGFIENQSVYYNLTYGIGLDYSLAMAPKITNGFIVLNLNGSIVDLENKFYFEQDSIGIANQEFVQEGKNIQVMFSEYALNSAIDTLEDKIKFEIHTEDFGKNSTVKLDTSMLDLFFKDTSKIYGKGKNIRIGFGLMKEDSEKKLNISANDIILRSELNCVILIQIDDESYEQAIRFTTNLNFEADFNLKEAGTVSANIKNFEVSESKIIESTLTADAEYLEQFVDFMSPLLMPYVNKQYLNLIHVNIPSVEGVSLDDSSAYLVENGIYLEVNPILNAEFVKNIKLGKFFRGVLGKYFCRSLKTKIRTLNLK